MGMSKARWTIVVFVGWAIVLLLWMEIIETFHQIQKEEEAETKKNKTKRENENENENKKETDTNNNRGKRKIIMQQHIIPPRHQLLRAFPGAEGEGAFARGGRGGDVYHVTSLNDSAVGVEASETGTLRHAIDSMVYGKPRTVVFDVAGTIVLSAQLNITKPCLTLAGHTAPGDGIAIRGWTVAILGTSHIIVRYLRFRPGDENCPHFNGDSLTVENSTDVIIDHVSASWSVDETLSVTWSHRVTVQWSIISESLLNSCHQEGRHGLASLVRYGNGSISFHHNLYAYHHGRLPRLGDQITLDWVGNVIFYWTLTFAGFSYPDPRAHNRINIVDNYYDNPSKMNAKQYCKFIFRAAFNESLSQTPTTAIYLRGNLVDLSVKGGQRFPVPVDETGNLLGKYNKSEERFSMENPVTNEGGAFGAYRNVLYDAGASLARDAVDIRIVRQVKRREGKNINSQKEVGGWPTLRSSSQPASMDTDGDGIPDDVETEMRLNPSDSTDGSAIHIHGGGYTNLEVYHNSLVKERMNRRSQNLASLIS